MANKTLSYSAFFEKFNSIAPEKRRFEVFSDFVTMSAIALANHPIMNQDREAEYFQIIHRYEKEDQSAIAELLGILVQIMEAHEPRDILGFIYMELGFSEVNKGQFFTPDEVSAMMAQITMGDIGAQLEEKNFVTVSDPACGAGSMILAFIHQVRLKSFNPQQCVWVEAWDIDRVSALMCFIQLSLWHIPARIVVGDTLAYKPREIWLTPTHHLGLWEGELRRSYRELSPCNQPEAKPPKSPPKVEIFRENADPVQLSFFDQE